MSFEHLLIILRCTLLIHLVQHGHLPPRVASSLSGFPSFGSMRAALRRYIGCTISDLGTSEGCEAALAKCSELLCVASSTKRGSPDQSMQPTKAL
jgi:hypothetical protein